MRHELIVHYQEQLARCEQKIAEAASDFIRGVRNAPHSTLDTYLHRARAFHYLLHEEDNETLRLYAEDLLVKYPEPLTPREVAEEELGSLTSNERQFFNKLWDEGNGAYAVGVISLGRSVDAMILSKVNECLKHG